LVQEVADFSQSLKTADQGDPKAQLAVAVIYGVGFMVSRDDAIAANWSRRAADQGDAFAQNNIGGMYAAGRGWATDDAIAASCYWLCRTIGTDWQGADGNSWPIADGLLWASMRVKADNDRNG
jgi:hypothetical protein